MDIVISLDEIISLIRNLNKGKATGPDEISVQMLMCDDSIATPRRIIYEIFSRLEFIRIYGNQLI